MPKIQIDTKFKKDDMVVAGLTVNNTKLPHIAYAIVKVLGLENIRYIFQDKPQIYYMVQDSGVNYTVHENQLMTKDEFIKLISRM